MASRLTLSAADAGQSGVGVVYQLTPLKREILRDLYKSLQVRDGRLHIFLLRISF